MKTAPNLKQAAIFFCQCEAGVYNYVDLNTQAVKHNQCDIVAIGAAGLHSSLSAMMFQGISVSLNIFLMHVYMWIKDPIDIDGDGRASVMDCFKFATINTYNQCRLQERDYSIATEATKVKLSLFLEEHVGRELTEDEKLQEKAMEEKMNMVDFSQTPWILNAYPAMRFFFD